MIMFAPDAVVAVPYAVAHLLTHRTLASDDFEWEYICTDSHARARVGVLVEFGSNPGGYLITRGLVCLLHSYASATE